MSFKKFPKIQQYRHIVQEAKQKGIDQDIFIGTVKLHGTNSSIRFHNAGKEVFFGSRKRQITPEDDNFGFAEYMTKKVDLNHLYNEITAQIPTASIASDIHVYGEWCGKGIQKGVAISEVDPFFVIFAVRIDHNWDDSEYTSHWFSTHQVADIETKKEERIFNIYNFGIWRVEVDFKNPDAVRNEMVDITNQVEACCPVGKSFGVEGTGEGVVWKSMRNPELIFKVKGDKHSVTKVKKLANVNPEKVKTLEEFVDNTVTENRLNQGLDHLKEMGYDPNENSSIPEFLKWIVNDILEEEGDVIENSSIHPKDYKKAITRKVRDWFLNR